MTLALAVLSLLCSLVPCLLFCANLRLYRVPAVPAQGSSPAVSILIPARNEAAGIEAAVRSALQSSDCVLEVVVMDDQSTDDTAAIVRRLALEDERVRLESAPALPAGWNGKQHACWTLAHSARYPLLCFVDADVRLNPQCIARMAAFLDTASEGGGASLVSGFPRQITGTPLEWLLLPLIHFVLLGFLPLARMRAGTDPAFAAGCGQFMLARAADYFACGGHSGIKLTMHDGLRLPRLFREHGLRTDLADLTPLASCRMYTSARQTWNGLAKNATEGIADPKRIVPVSLVLLLGQVLPFVPLLLLVLLAVVERFLGLGVFVTHRWAAFASVLAWTVSIVAAWLPRVLAAVRFRQDWRSVVLHPLGIIVLLVLQWYALLRKVSGRQVSWRDRSYLKAAE